MTDAPPYFCTEASAEWKALPYGHLYVGLKL